MRTRQDIIDAHERLAALHAHLAKTAILDVIHEHHEDLAARLAQEAKDWREMKDSTFESKTQSLPA